METPEFAGLTFHEVLARSALNKVPGAARVPFEWTVNPYRGCSHACTYCFARRTHSYLELDTGADFDTQIVVKVNVDTVLRRELADALLSAAQRWCTGHTGSAQRHARLDGRCGACLRQVGRQVVRPGPARR